MKSFSYILYIAFTVLTFQSTAIFGQGHEDIFPDKSGSELLNLLRTSYKPSTVLDYYHARLKMYTEIYNENDTVYGIYTRYGLHLAPNDPDPIGTLIRNNSPYGINTEHTFPQSKGAREGNARSDMHHLFPAMARVNSARSNYPYAEINDNRTQWWYYKDKAVRSIPTKNKEDYSESIDGAFEPREDVKGDVARAMFYFMTMYRSQADASFFSGQRKTLCQWHLDDPVDSVEWARNDMKARYQSGKKNPFILDCTLAYRTFCPEFPTNCIVANLDVLKAGTIATVHPSPSKGKCTIDIQANAPVQVQITAYNVSGKITGEARSNTFSQKSSLPMLLQGSGLHVLIIKLRTPQEEQITLVKKVQVN